MARIEIAYPGSTLFTHEIPIRVTDLNYANHLAHDKLVSVLHEVRARFFLAHGVREDDTDGFGVILTDLAVAYKGEAFYPQVLRVEVAIDDVTRKGCDFLYRVTLREGGKLVALAKTGIVFFDYQARSVVSIPARFLAIIGRET